MQTSVNNIGSVHPPLAPSQAPFDLACEAIREGNLTVVLDDLFDYLSLYREEEAKEWPAFARACLGHPIRRLLHQDPFTYRAFAKPRGYAGDAVMMDYIYGLGEAERAAREATPIGRAIFSHMGTRPSARAVRYRRELLASLIDRAAGLGGDRVFALAAGHLREAELSDAMRAGTLAEFVAMDQDEASLAVVAHDYAHLGVQAMSGSVRQILSRKVKLGQFDLVYAAGLFDYLDAPVAAALTSRLFDMTRPGGTMLIPNFRAGARDSGYMEAFMDWHLIYRSHADMQALLADVPSREIDSAEIFDDDDETITFLKVSKAC